MNEPVEFSQITNAPAHICQFMGAEKPAHADEPDKRFLDYMKLKCSENYKKRALIYNPDAVGMWLFKKYEELFKPVIDKIEIQLPVKSVYPSKTPVCFASMYSGVNPDIHGIKGYVKPVLTVETIFDTLSKANIRVAIAAVEKSSMSIIFSGRSIDYYIRNDDEAVIMKALELIENDSCDCLIVYNQEYDDTMHRTQPESQESIDALSRHIQAFSRLCEAAGRYWSQYETLVAFLPDHGVHLSDDGKGTHGADIPEDMEIMHFYGVYCPENHNVK